MLAKAGTHATVGCIESLDKTALESADPQIKELLRELAFKVGQYQGSEP